MLQSFLFFTFACNIKKLVSGTMENIFYKLKRYVSPVFLVLLIASFILWYIAKLNYNYTTEQEIRVNVDGEEFRISCVVEGLGTNLFGYKAYTKKTLRIPLSELQYTSTHNEAGEERLQLDAGSLQHAISVRFSDIKVISIGAIPDIAVPAEKSAKGRKS